MKRPFPALSLLLLLLSLGGADARAQVVISEFVAENAASATDEDGDHPDWIELLNLTAAEVNLDGWFLSDDPFTPMKWRFPAVTVPGRGYLIVFASEKDRAVAAAPLHTNFALNNAGESVLLVKPDGTTVASSFLNYPAQHEDVGYGIGRETLAGPLVAQGSPMRAFVPTNGDLGLTWTGASEPFPDGAWQSGTAGAGYDVAPPSAGGLAAYWDFNDASNPALTTDSSGNARHGTVEGGATFSAGGGGRTGAAGDRAMNFPNSASARVRIASAATGAFDALTSANACAISVWIFGDASQPAPDSLFFAGSNIDGSGERSLNAHVPWSDSVIYWDTANFGDCCSGNSRISAPEPNAARWRGQWNHYVFSKNGATKQIWQNGALLAQGSNINPIALIRSFWIGSAPFGAYGGKVDDFAVWSRALSAAEIAQLAAGASPLTLLGFGNLIGINLGTMRGVNPSAYLRAPFTLAAPPDYDALELRVKYDDGFIAYLNGTEIARRDVPASPSWNSTATTDRARTAALNFVPLEITGGAALIGSGTNILALHALNESASSDELLVLPELVKVRTNSPRYLVAPTPGTPNSAGALGFVAETQFSVDRGWFSAPFQTAISCATPGAMLVYTTNGSVPALTNGTVVNPPDANTAPIVALTITGTTTLRAAAFKAGYQPANTNTQTYLFAAQVAQQPAILPGWPASWPGGFPGDYQMDPNVVNTTQPGYGVGDALLSIPSVSVTGTLANITNLYANSTSHDLEAAVAIEWIDPRDSRSNFKSDGGLHIHGNISRDKNFTPKHAFRLNFSSRYGPRSLQQPLFPGSPVEKFDQIVLKSLSTDTWPVSDTVANSTIDGDLRWERAEASYIRDEFFRRTHLATGQLAAHGRFAHLFLNDVYWGLVNVIERPSADFCSEHLGSERGDWDVLKDFNELEEGDRAAWDQLLALATAGFSSEANYQRAQGRNPDGTRNPAFPVLLSVPSLIDYMIVHIACGADDWPNHNWYSARRRTADSEGFLFFAWDQEISNNSVLKQHSSWGPLYEQVSAAGTPAQLYASARGNAGFRRQFGDRVQALLFNGGALTQAACVARWNALKAEVDKALVAESARWGDYRRATPYKREVEWLPHMNWMNSIYWPQFVSRAVTRFRNAGLFPVTNPPLLSQQGGTVPAGFTLAITNPNGAGTLYYTTNNADPTQPGAPTYADPIPINSLVTVRARVRNGAEWSALTEATFQPDQDLGALIVTEIHFDPPGASGIPGDEFEFIELQNVGATTLDLSRMTFTQGIAFTFADGTSLAPGACVVIARNPAQFAARFGAAALGPYEGKLDNTGETLALVSALGAPIFSFTYGVAPAWAATNGGSLHYLSGVPGSAFSWFSFHATPGVHDADADGDGMSNLAEAIAGTNPGSATSVLRVTTLARQPAGSTVGTFQAVAGRTYSVLVSDDLTTWTHLPPNLTPSTTGPITFTDPNPAGPQRFYKIVTPAQP